MMWLRCSSAAVFVWQIFLLCDLQAWDVQRVDRRQCHYNQQQRRSNVCVCVSLQPAAALVKRVCVCVCVCVSLQPAAAQVKCVCVCHYNQQLRRSNVCVCVCVCVSLHPLAVQVKRVCVCACE